MHVRTVHILHIHDPIQHFKLFHIAHTHVILYPHRLGFSDADRGHVSRSPTSYTVHCNRRGRGLELHLENSHVYRLSTSHAPTGDCDMKKMSHVCRIIMCMYNFTIANHATQPTLRMKSPMPNASGPGRNTPTE